MLDGVLDPVVDLLLGAACVGCARPGRLLCARCRSTLPRVGHPAVPSPPPPGLAPCFAAAAYDGVVRELVVGLKEHRMLGLRAPLADLLRASVAAATDAAGAEDAPLVLVPVPSRRATTRARGHAPVDAVARRAAALLRAGGRDVLVVPLLRLRPGVVDQAGLGAAARGANLAGSMCCPTPGVRRLARRRPRARVVVCDDVLTTGATAREAQRALEAVGLPVVAVAAVAATRRRHPPGDVSVTGNCLFGDFRGPE